MQEFLDMYTLASPFLGTDELKMAFQVRKVSGAFAKQAPDGFFISCPCSRVPERSSGGHGFNVRRGTHFTFFIPCTCQTQIFWGVKY